MLSVLFLLVLCHGRRDYDHVFCLHGSNHELSLRYCVLSSADLTRQDEAIGRLLDTLRILRAYGLAAVVLKLVFDGYMCTEKA